MPKYYSQLYIRQIKYTDLRSLEWDGQYTHFRRMYKQTYKRALRGENILWCAELLGIGVMGQLFVQLISNRKEVADGYNRAYIFAVRVHPKYRGSGIGTQLFTYAEIDLVLRGYSIATLNVAMENHSAIRLYQRLGYKIVGIEPGRWSYIDHRGRKREIHEPSWRMEKFLDKNISTST
ncbi:MAG: GNAT family N-acetyltransferase [Anaerolineales bacterium]